MIESLSAEGPAVNVLGTLDYLMNVTSSAERRGRSDDLVQSIADALAASGEYVTHLDRLPAHHALDLKWAVHQAARDLGTRILVEVEHTTMAAARRARVRVKTQRPPA